MARPTAEEGQGIIDVGYRRYVLGVLMAVYVFNFIDRQILVILQESIKLEMGLSDAQLGLLSGFAFAIFYVSFGIPIARWADHSNRRNIIALSLTLWSTMTAMCGLVQGYGQLLAARIGVGVGEAGGSPPAHSMISDYFPFNERATALAIYSVGIYIGILIGFLAGGWINEFFGWRVAFMVVGVPGIFLALLLRLTVREPVRGQWDDPGHARTPPSWGEAVRLLWSLPSFRSLCLGAGLIGFVGYGIGNFMPSFLSRIHGLSTGEVGTVLGLTVGIGGALGTYLGGFLSSRLGRRDRRWYLWVPAAGSFLTVPLGSLAFLVDQLPLALAFYCLSVVMYSMFLAPNIAISHGLVPPRMRALTSAVLFLVLNLIGLGLGPLTTGLVSDILASSLGVESIRWALVATNLSGLLAAGAYLASARQLKADLART